jgi:small conductance mechanosensitive channel
MNKTTEIISLLNNYGSLLANGLVFLLVGMLIIFLLYKLATRFVYPHLNNPRLFRVIFGALYVLVLVVTVLLVLNRLGYDTSNIGKPALLVVVIGAAIIFFLSPFIPSLPFKIGNMVEINGVTGIVDAITSFHTHIRTFDGRMVFLPNALVMASRITNFHFTPTRRIELVLDVQIESDVARARELLLEIMQGEKQVLADPEPTVLVSDANAQRVQLAGYCWVNNGDWMDARTGLWLLVVEAFQDDNRVSLALPRQEVHLEGEGVKSVH